MNNKRKNSPDEVNLVKALSDIVNKDKLSELEYETDVCKVKIVKHSNPVFSNVPSIENQTINTIPLEKKNKIIPTSEEYNNKHPGAVNSPMVGTAYSASEPGKNPFVKINSSVTKGDTLLIIEAMKVMNTITAHKSGKVTFIGFEDGQPIEFDQLLIVIE